MNTLTFHLACVSVAIVAAPLHVLGDTAAIDADKTVDELPALQWTVTGKTGAGVRRPDILQRRITQTKPPLAPADTTISTATFQPGAVYKAPLGPEAFADGVFISFNFSGVAAVHPEDRTVLSIGGISLAYAIEQHVGRAPLIRLVALNSPSGGNAEWVPTNLVIFPHKDYVVGSGPRLSIKLHPLSHTYDLYSNNFLLKKDLHYPVTSDPTPMVEVNPGASPVPIRVRALRVGANPSNRTDVPVDANGRLASHRNG